MATPKQTEYVVNSSSNFLEKVRMASTPFAPEDHEWKPLSITEKGAWIVFYVDMRKMMERLQQIFGETVSIHLSSVGGNGYNVLATLTVRVGDDVVTYQDFGYASPDTAEGLKSAATDAYRRVLSHLGIGRYLYHLPKIFIGGRRNGYRFVPKRDPIEVLADILQNGTDKKVLFIDAEEDDAVWTGRNGKNAEANSEKGETADSGKNKKTANWLQLLGAESQEEAVNTLRVLTKKQGVSYTDKQLYALIRMVEPNEKTVEDISKDPTQVKALLDSAFSKLKGKS